MITITAAHCQQCGSTDNEDLTTGDQGYTACCNERIVGGQPTGFLAPTDWMGRTIEPKCDPRECSHK